MLRQKGEANKKQQLLLACCVLFFLSFLEVRLVAGGDSPLGVPPDMTQEKLEKEVPRRFRYIETRLLSGRSAKIIEASGNAQAMEILRHSKGRMPEVEAWISEGRLGEAYVALQEIARSMREALQLARARERGVKKLKDEMEETRVVNQAYFERAMKRGVNSAGGEIRKLMQQAQKARAEAEIMRERLDYKGAKDSFGRSTQLLKKAITLSRERKN